MPVPGGVEVEFGFEDVAGDRLGVLLIDGNTRERYVLVLLQDLAHAGVLRQRKHHDAGRHDIGCTQQFGVQGMNCASCAVSLESWLKNKAGVKEVSVNYPNQSAKISFDPRQTNLEQMNSAAREIGFSLVEGTARELQAAKQDENVGELALLRKQLIIAAVFSIPVFVIAMFFMGKIPGENYIMLALSTPVLFFSGKDFFVNAWKKARHWTSNMDTLVALSTGIAFAFSLFNTLFPQVFLWSKKW